MSTDLPGVDQHRGLNAYAFRVFWVEGRARSWPRYGLVFLLRVHVWRRRHLSEVVTSVSGDAGVRLEEQRLPVR